MPRIKASLLLLLCLPSLVVQAESGADNPRVVLETSKGPITVELLASDAPQSTANFLAYVEAGFYDGTIFHRVIPDFVIQGGGFTADMTQKETRPPIENEAGNGLVNVRGTLAMARRSDPHSATSQFFINLAENNFLDHQSASANGWGYAVFGRVVDGMDVVDAIAQVPTGVARGMPDVPLTAVTITAARVVE